MMKPEDLPDPLLAALVLIVLAFAGGSFAQESKANGDGFQLMAS